MIDHNPRMTPTNDAPVTVEPAFLLMKRGLFYRPGNAGYTGIKADAGRYNQSEADELSGVTAIHENDAPMFAPACWEDVKVKHLLGIIAERDRSLAALASAPAGDGEYRVNPDRSGLERMTMMDDEMGLPDEPMPLSPNAVPEWHGEAFHNAMLASSEPVDPVSDEAILDLATEMLAREWEKDRNPIYADMIRKGEDVHRSSIVIRAIAAALARPRAAVPLGSDAAYFGASDAACTLYPGTDQQAERAAFCEGAAHAVSSPRAAVGEQSGLAAQVLAYDAMLRGYSGPLTSLCKGDEAKIDAAYDALVASALALQSPPAKVEG